MNIILACLIFLLCQCGGGTGGEIAAVAQFLQDTEYELRSTDSRTTPSHSRFFLLVSKCSVLRYNSRNKADSGARHPCFQFECTGVTYSVLPR